MNGTCYRCGGMWAENEMLGINPQSLCRCVSPIKEKPSQPFMTNPPTNEPKMPEVIYAVASSISKSVGAWLKNKEYISEPTSYTHTDKVQELEEKLNELCNLISKRLSGVATVDECRRLADIVLETSATSPKPQIY